MSRSIGISEAVEAYIRAANRNEHPVLARCRKETYAEADIPAMQISPEQAAFMALLARLLGAKTYIEIGVFTGYSSLAIGLALKDMHGERARVVACDISKDYIDMASDYWCEAGIERIVDARIAPARATLRALDDEVADMIFVDADKTGYPDYYAEGARLLRPGGLMLFDNVLWDGDVADVTKDDDDVVALRQTANLAKADERFDIAFTTIGDGLLICRKRG